MHFILHDAYDKQSFIKFEKFDDMQTEINLIKTNDQFKQQKHKDA